MIESVMIVGMEGQMYRYADGWINSQSVERTDRRMDKASDRVANLKLKDSIAHYCVLQFAAVLAQITKIPTATCSNMQQLAAIFSFVLFNNHLLHTVSEMTCKTLYIVKIDQE